MCDADASKALFIRLTAGEEAAAVEAFDLYVDRLAALAQSRLSARLAQRIDADDVVQSAFRSFFCGAREGRFVHGRGGDLWRLLSAIAINKVRMQARRHGAGRRDAAKEAALGDEIAGDFVTTREPDPAEAAALIDELESLYRELPPNRRTMLELRLAGATVEEIADSVACSERTVRRFLKELQQRFADSPSDDEPSPTEAAVDP